MFNISVKTAMGTPTARKYFANKITGREFAQDDTLFSTVCSLVAPRMKDGDTLKLQFINTYLNNDDDIMSTLSEIMKPNTLTICLLADIDQNDNLNGLRKRFPSVKPGIIELEKVHLFFRDKFIVLCFVNPEERSTMLFMKKFEAQRYHYLQCAMFAFLPWYFDPKDGCSDEEMEIIESLRESTPDHYLKCMEREAAKYDFQNIAIKEKLKNFSSYAQIVEKNRRVQNIQNCRNNIEQWEDLITNATKQIEESEIYLLGLEIKNKERSEDDLLANYFMANKSLKLVNRSQDSDKYIYFIVSSYCEYYNEENAAKVIDAPKSYVYSVNGCPRTGCVTRNEMKNLMYAIFVENILRVRFSASYSIDVEYLSGFAVRESNLSLYGNSMPNPHIQEYKCLGNYQQTISESLRKYDYIGAMEQCIASCKSLNFADPPVMNEFMNNLYRGTYCCIELPDGSVVNTREAVDWLKTNDKYKFKEQDGEANE